MKSLLRGLAITTAISVALTLTSYAQTLNDDIIVTSTKRVTTLKEAPLAVSVTDSETIENAR
ncbi:hypothetical protein OAN06_05910, partial [Hellea sp.]|nr:hypothetical protein [Hellea sp.]